MNASAEPVPSNVERDLARMLPALAAAELERLAPAEAAAILKHYAGASAVPVWERLAPAIAQRCMAEFSVADAAQMLSGIDPSRAAAIIVRLDEEERAGLLAAVSDAARELIDFVMSFPPGSAGAIMDPRVWHLRGSTQVGEAIERVRQVAPVPGRSAGRRLFYLVDDEARLNGIVEAQDMILAQPDDTLGHYSRPVPAVAQVTMSNEEVVDLIDRHGLSSLPVVDSSGRLIGVVRYDSLVAATRAEASVDLQTIFGASKEERALSPPGFAVRKRLPWLQINLVTAFMAAAVVGLFEDTIASNAQLAVLLPVVAGQSGNTGAQALAVVIRGLALREINASHWRKVVGKEFLAALVNGIAIAATTSAAVFLWSRSGTLSAIIGMSMVLSMVIAGLAGAAIPLALTKLRQDPAQSSSIVLTTVTDVAGFFSFLGIATLLLHAM